MTTWTPQSLRLPRGRAYDPFTHAEALQVQILFRPLEQAHEYWDEPTRTVYIKDGIREIFQRCAAAHGLAHMILGHPDRAPKWENQANRLASIYLIHPRELAEVARWTDDRAVIAQELGVTPRLLRAYQAGSA